MIPFHTLPDEVIAVFGHPAAEKFVDFLNSSLSVQKEDAVAVATTHFESRLVREASAIRLEIAEMRSEIADLRAETRTEIAEVRTEIAELRGETTAAIAGLRAEMKADFASIQKDITGLHGQIAGLHRDISAQTKWMLVGLASAVTFYPIITRLVARLIP